MNGSKIVDSSGVNLQPRVDKRAESREIGELEYELIEFALFLLFLFGVHTLKFQMLS